MAVSFLIPGEKCLCSLLYEWDNECKLHIKYLEYINFGLSRTYMTVAARHVKHTKNNDKRHSYVETNE